MRLNPLFYLKNAIIVILCITFYYSCSNTVNDPKSNDEPTPVIFKLTIVNPPSTVHSIVGELERNGYDPVFKSFIISGDTAIGDFGSIAAGIWHLSVTAYDSNQVATYYGETDVTIQAGQLNIVNLHMNPLTGELVVVVT